MRTFFLFSLLCLLSSSVFAQKTLIKGQVLDKSKTPLVGANIALRDTYDGATADADGRFQFETEETGPQILQVTYLGYDSVNQRVTLSGGVFEFNPILKEGFNELKVVVISAGAFEASDERRVTVLKPLDIVTTASASGDTYNALKTLPGAQVSTGDKEGLFVRGGSGTEAQTFIDGMLVRNPFFASTPDFASRGRFNPFLFKGTIFSTGGYSAQYGQGMSSALVLETQDLPDRSAGSAGVSCVGFNYGQQQIWADKGRSAGVNVNYTNVGPYFSLVNQDINFTHSPEYIGAETFLRQKTKSSGMLKFYGYYNHGNVGFTDDAPNNGKFGFSVKNNNVYTNLSWAGLLQNKWKLNLGTSYSNDWNDIASSYDDGFLQSDSFRLRSSLSQVRAVATRFFGRLTSLRLGGEYQIFVDDFDSQRFAKSSLHDNYSAFFAESDLYITTKIVARFGLRAEHSSLLDEAKLSPRVSLAYKVGDGAQFSFAWGNFYQKGDSLLRWQSQYGTIPGFQRAEHYILNYQYILNERTFRVEGFYKKYNDLITTNEGLHNDGKGYAQGIELFYRDKKTLPTVDVWVSYSYLDTKRKFQWYPVEAQPTFAANHVASLVAKKFISKISTSVGMTYNYATGRPYFNPNRPASEFLIDRTPAYNSLSLNASYLTNIRKAFAVVVFSVTNVLGQQQIFDYRYSADGRTRTAISPSAKSFVFLGLFVSWGTDRRQQVLDQN